MMVYLRGIAGKMGKGKNTLGKGNACLQLIKTDLSSSQSSSSCDRYFSAHNRLPLTRRWCVASWINSFLQNLKYVFLRILFFLNCCNDGYGAVTGSPKHLSMG